MPRLRSLRRSSALDLLLFGRVAQQVPSPDTTASARTSELKPIRAKVQFLLKNGDGTSHDVSFQWVFNVGRSHTPFFNRLLSQGDYLKLLDWTVRQVTPGKRGTTPPSTPPLFQQLSGKLPTATAWVELVQDFDKLFATVADHPQTIRATRSRISGFPHRMRPRVGELLPAS